MSDFQTQIQAYTGTLTVTAEISNWLTTGARRLIDRLPIEKLLKNASTTEIDVLNGGVDMAGYRIVNPHKDGRGAIIVESQFYNQLIDPNSIHYATPYCPMAVYHKGKFHVLPNGGKATVIAYPAVAYTESAINDFPVEMEKLVVLDAAIQGALSKMSTETVVLDALTLGAVTTNINAVAWATAYPNQYSAFTTSLAAIATQVGNAVTEAGKIAGEIAKGVTAITVANTEIDLAKTEAAKIEGEITLAKAQIVLASAEVLLSNTEADKISAQIALADAELDEAATQVDDSIDTALAAIVTAAGRINTAVGLANAEFDKVSTIIDSANTEYDKITAVVAAGSTTVTDGSDIDKGLAQLQASTGYATSGDTYVKEAEERIRNGNAYLEEAKASLGEVQGYAAEVNSRIQQIQGYSAVANGYLGTAQGYAQGGDNYAKTAAGYIQSAQGYLGTVQAYGSEVQAYMSTAMGYLQEVQKDIDVAMGYSAGARTYLEAGRGYAEETQTRLSVLQTEIAEYSSIVNKEASEYNLNIQRSRSAIESWRLLIDSLEKQYENLLKAFL